MNNDNQPSKHKKTHRKPIFTVLIILVPIVLALLVVAGIFFGRLSISIKNPNQTVTVNTIVCNDDIINRYNTAVLSKTVKEYNDSLKLVVNDVEKLPSYEKDQNCSFILYQYYSYISDKVKMRQYFDQLKGHDERGNYLSGKIINPDSIYRMESHVNSVESSGNTSAGGSG